MKKYVKRRSSQLNTQLMQLRKWFNNTKWMIRIIVIIIVFTDNDSVRAKIEVYKSPFFPLFIYLFIYYFLRAGISFL